MVLLIKKNKQYFWVIRFLARKINFEHYYGFMKDFTNKQEGKKEKEKEHNHAQENNTKDLSGSALGRCPQAVAMRKFL